MLDVVIGNGSNEREFISRAKELGYNSLLLVYEDASVVSEDYLSKLVDESNIVLSFGILNKGLPKNKQITKRIVLGTSFKGFSKDIDYVYDLEYVEEKDHLHQRKSGANEVFLRQCKDLGIDLLVSLNELRSQSSSQQSLAMGRISQNVALSKKLNVSVHFVSMAKEPSQMRHSKDVSAFLRVLA